MKRWATDEWHAMGSVAEVVVYHEQAPWLVVRARQRAEELEACWSRFRPESELSALNARAGSPVVVSPRLWSAILAAREAWEATAGRFDPTVLPALRALGYDRTFHDVIDDPDVPLPALTASPGFGRVALHPATRTVHLPLGCALDLGGIGKGLAADLIADELASHGASVAVSMGGDVAVRGPGPDADAAWPVRVEQPHADLELGAFQLVDESIVQSTTRFRRWRRGGAEQHHLVDPSTGHPTATGVVTAVVTGPRAGFAEAVAKAAIVAGPVDGPRLIRACGLDGWLLLADGSMRATDAVRGDLVAVSSDGPDGT
jgi:thiamine biosynthesis lipoprotein